MECWCPQEQRSIEVKGSFAQWTHLTFPNDLPVDALSERTFRRQEVLSCFQQFGSKRVPIYLFINSLNINLAGLKQSPQSLEFMDTGQGREHASPPSSAPESRSLGGRSAVGPTCRLATPTSQVVQLLTAVEGIPKKGLKVNQVFSCPRAPSEKLPPFRRVQSPWSLQINEFSEPDGCFLTCVSQRNLPTLPFLNMVQGPEKLWNVLWWGFSEESNHFSGVIWRRMFLEVGKGLHDLLTFLTLFESSQFHT